MSSSFFNITSNGPRTYRYGFAIIISFLALSLQLSVLPYLGSIQFLFLLPAIFLIAWFAGLGPTVFATLILALGADYFFISPIYAFSFSSPVVMSKLMLFAVISTSIGFLIKRSQTSDRRYQESLKKAEDIRFALDSSSIVAITDVQGKITYANDKFCEISKFSREELIGKDHRVINSGFHSKGFFHEMWETILGGKVWAGDIRNRAKDGSIYWVSTIIVPFLDRSGRPYQFMAIRTDITQKKLFEEALAYQSSLTRTITENATSCLFMMDQNGHPTFMNPAAIRVTGYASLDEIKDRPLHYAIHWKKPDGSHYPMAECPIDNAQSSLTTIRGGEETFCRKDGTLFPVSFSIVPLEREGKVVGSVLEFRDITEEKKAIEIQKRAMEEVKAALQVRDEFMSIASHELKTPLTAFNLQIQMLSRLIERGPGPNDSAFMEKIRKAVMVCENQARRFTELLNELLDLTRIRTGRLQLKTMKHNLSEVVADVIERLRVDAETKSINVNFSSFGKVECLMDRSRIEQVVANLLSNAFKYGESRPVTVSVHQDNAADVGLLTVTDSGRGIPPELQKKVFERFERGNADLNISGLGLGLYITRQIVEAHGGRIFLTSEVGKGSTFTVQLPLVKNSST